jgi:hypothetical protein
MTLTCQLIQGQFDFSLTLLSLQNERWRNTILALFGR